VIDSVPLGDGRTVNAESGRPGRSTSVIAASNCESRSMIAFHSAILL
jgi:hypothetical protein